MKRSFLFICFFITAFWGILSAQDRATYDLFLKFSEYYGRGDFINAETSLKSVIESSDPPEVYVVAAYNNLGLINYHMGKFEESLAWYNLAEASISKKQNSRELADIYINKSNIYLVQKSFKKAIEYLEKSLEIYLGIKSPDMNTQQRISTGYMNLGIVYYKISDYKNAIYYLGRSFDLKAKFSLNEKALLYLSLAKVYAATGKGTEADDYFQKSIAQFSKESGVKYYRLAETYFEYGLFLESQKSYKKALSIHNEALSICRMNYGEKHNLTSLAYKNIGDFFLKNNKPDSALVNFQKSLISVVNDFNDTDIFSNPNIDSVILDIRLLDNLKSKAKALEFLAAQQNSSDNQSFIRRKSLETIELALNLIDRIRVSYPSQESKIFLAENEKETYLFAVHIAGNLYKLTKDKSFVLTMFNVAQKSKAAVLRNEIYENELVYSGGVPDSLRTKQIWLAGNISAYDNMVAEEQRKSNPDSNKISFWKNAIFEMKRENERNKEIIVKNYPQFNELLQKTNPATLDDLRKHLSDDETVVDYLLSNVYSDGKRKLYIFLVSKSELGFCETDIDSLMKRNTETVLCNMFSSGSKSSADESFAEYTTALYYMYEKLIKPVEGLIKGNRLIVIPDEEIGLLPFDAFLKSKPLAGIRDFEGLQYLINEYSFSFRYSSSMITGNKEGINTARRLIAFTPDYSSNYDENTLHGAEKETDAILKLFRGKKFSGKDASKLNFIQALRTPAIFHLAMHSLPDTSDSKFSYLLFEHDKDSLNSGKLYNYEVSISKIKSPMVVLSACNSGSGKMYNGEGILSIARGFILAGASSVIMTKWEINDESSSEIIRSFYYFLAKGNPKDKSMRLAKLDFIKSHPPYYSNPYYWAGYEVLGDNSQIVAGRRILIPLISAFVIFISAALYFFSRRRIFPARSL